MTIQDAIRSGRPFKRKIDTCWINPHEPVTFGSNYILADDWETKIEPREWMLIGTCGAYWIVDGPELPIGDLKKFKVREVIE